MQQSSFSTILPFVPTQTSRVRIFCSHSDGWILHSVLVGCSSPVRPPVRKSFIISSMRAALLILASAISPAIERAMVSKSGVVSYTSRLRFCNAYIVEVRTRRRAMESPLGRGGGGRVPREGRRLPEADPEPAALQALRGVRPREARRLRPPGLPQRQQRGRRVRHVSKADCGPGWGSSKSTCALSPDCSNVCIFRCVPPHTCSCWGFINWNLAPPLYKCILFDLFTKSV